MKEQELYTIKSRILDLEKSFTFGTDEDCRNSLEMYMKHTLSDSLKLLKEINDLQEEAKHWKGLALHYMPQDRGRIPDDDML
jgi:predicted  nucleic acid-binding Zn-ribbon protein